jgi:hypothetical protein
MCLYINCIYLNLAVSASVSDPTFAPDYSTLHRAGDCMYSPAAIILCIFPSYVFCANIDHVLTNCRPQRC